MLGSKRKATQIMRVIGARKESKTADLESKMAAKQDSGLRKIPCEDKPIDCNLFKAADEFLEAVAGATATGEAGSFPDFTMVTCEA
jgi:hypothetical protein